MTRPLAATFVFLYGCMAIFCLLTPLISDDYYFGSSSAQPFAAIMAGEPVLPFGPSTFAGIFRRAAQMYATWDGRFMAYVTFGFHLWLPGVLYALLAAGMFCATVWLALLHVTGPGRRRRLTPLSVALMAAALWWGMPTFGSVWFWRTGLAYAADMCCALLFLLPFRRLLEEPDLRARPVLSPVAAAVWLPLSLFFGLLQYNTPLLCLMGGTAAVCVLWYRNAALPPGERLRRLFPLIAGLAVLLAGIAVIFSAPGNAQRILIRESWFLSLSLCDKIRLWLLDQPKVQALFWLPWVLVIWSIRVFVRRYGRVFWRHLPPLGIAFSLLGQMGQGAYLFAPSPDSRAYTSAFLFMLLGGGVLARAALDLAGPASARRARRIALAFLGMVLLTLPHELSLFLSGKAELDARDRVYAAAEGRHVRVEPLKTRGDRFFVLGAYQQDITHDPDFWINQAVARHWKLASVALRMPPDRLFSSTDGEGRRLRFLQRGATLRVLPSAELVAGRSYYVYYYGKAGLVRYLPACLADALTRWLQRARPGDARLWLTPLLYAQARCGEGDAAAVPLWGYYDAFPDAPLWLVRPGDGPASFRLEPLTEMPPPSLPAPCEGLDAGAGGAGRSVSGTPEGR